MKTTLCTRVGIEVPIIQAPMGGAVGPALASAVSNAGGLGMLALWRFDAETMREQIRETRALTSKPFGVNLNLEFPQDERLDVCLAEKVPVISFFWREPGALTEGWPVLSAFRGMIVNHIENDLDSSAMERLDHTPELIKHGQRITARTVSGMRSKEGDRRVPPVIG